MSSMPQSSLIILGLLLYSFTEDALWAQKAISDNTNSIIVMGNSNVIYSAAPSSNDMEMTVGCSDGDYTPFDRRVGPLNCGYHVSQLDNISCILPEDDYLRTYFDTGSILKMLDMPFGPHFYGGLPILDVRLINNTNDFVSVSEMDLAVSDSHPEKRPIIFIQTNLERSMTIQLYNMSNADITSCSVDYNVGMEKGDFVEVNAPKYQYKFHQNLGPFKLSRTFDLSQTLKKLGLNIEEMRRLKEIGAKADSKEAKAAFEGLYDYNLSSGFTSIGGVLHATTTEGASYDVRFSGLVPILAYYDGLGGAFEVDQSSQIEFKTSGVNYSIHVPVAAKIQPHEGSRILLLCGAKCSSWHHFKLSVITSEKTLTRNCTVFIFLPKCHEEDFDKQTLRRN